VEAVSTSLEFTNDNTLYQAICSEETFLSKLTTKRKIPDSLHIENNLCEFRLTFDGSTRTAQVFLLSTWRLGRDKNEMLLNII